MTELLICLIALVLLGLLLLILIYRKWDPSNLLSTITSDLAILAEKHNRSETVLKDEMSRNREEMERNASRIRLELSKALEASSDALLKRAAESAGMQKGQLDSFAKQLTVLTRMNEDKLETIRIAIENQLTSLREENSKKLDQMRSIVEEKLQATLESRLDASFKQVSERLEQVYKGLGEMQHLASGVGDLKKVLTNIKTRGTWGEIQLGSILEQILTPDQYGMNVSTKKGSRERVEFAVKLPGPRSDPDAVVWMPIDAKFPQEDYQRLLDAQDAADKEAADKSTHSLEVRIKAEARNIREKYIDPPNTTDFGIMFLPIEGLYAEVLRCPGLSDSLQREHRVIVTGPTTLAALLNSLQMGFRTLAIEKRSSDVWELLGVVKTEFGKFGDVLAKTKKKLQEAGNTIDQAAVRSRAIERKLRDVEDLPQEKRESLPNPEALD